MPCVPGNLRHGDAGPRRKPKRAGSLLSNRDLGRTIDDLKQPAARVPAEFRGVRSGEPPRLQNSLERIAALQRQAVRVVCRVFGLAIADHAFDDDRTRT